MSTPASTDDLPEPLQRRLAHLMRAAVDLGRTADAPFGCVLARLDDGEIVLGAGNTTFSDPTGHAEINAIRQAAGQGIDLTTVAIISTAEPCPMCMAATWWANVPWVVYGTSSQTLKQLGWRVIDVPAEEIARRGRGEPSVQIIGGWLSEETDVLYQSGPLPATTQGKPGGHLPGPFGG